MTEALVRGPKIPSAIRFPRLDCRHLTCSPVLPCLSVVVMGQGSAEGEAVGAVDVGVVKEVHGKPVVVLKM